MCNNGGLFGGSSCSWVLVLVIVCLLSQGGLFTNGRGCGCGCEAEAVNSCGCGCGCR